jgi:glycosyltransferase involved in cell wall biosynthesis
VCDAVRALSKLEYSGSLEIVIVVDGSPDDTASAIKEVECKFPKRVIEQSNQGPAHARNRGAAAANGEIILFLDDDMICAPDLIDQHVGMYHEGADAAVGHIPVDPRSPPGFLRDAVVNWIDSSRVGPQLTPFDIFSGQLSVRRSVFEKLGGFDEAFTSGNSFAHEDTDLGVRLLSEYNVRYNPNAISHQRYTVTPRELMRKACRAAVADLRFAAAHPEFSDQLLRHRGASRRRTRYFYRPLGRIPLLPKLTADFSVWIAEKALRSRFRSSSLVRKLFGASRSLLYWSTVQANGDIQSL